MSAHLHYDVEAMRVAFNTNAEETAERAMKSARNDKDRAYIRTQRLLSYAVTELLVRCAEAENEGAERLMVVRSAGLTLGKGAASIVKSFGDGALIEVLQAFSEGINVGREDRDTADFTSSHAAFHPMQSGHA